MTEITHFFNALLPCCGVLNVRFKMCHFLLLSMCILSWMLIHISTRQLILYRVCNLNLYILKYWSVAQCTITLATTFVSCVYICVQYMHCTFLSIVCCLFSDALLLKIQK